MSKEAMKLALELLKTAQNNLAPSKHSAHVYGDGELWDEYAEAIKALEEALAKQEQGEPVALKVYRGELCYKSQADDQSFGMWCPVTQDLPFPEGTRLYTTPQQRKPLTDEQIGDIAALFYPRWQGHEGFARAIEAAHGIKE
jgi:hypothetical protein